MINNKTNTEIIPQSNLQIQNTLEAIKRKNKTYDIQQIENGITIITINRCPFKLKEKFKLKDDFMRNILPPFEHHPNMRYKDFAKTLKR